MFENLLTAFEDVACNIWFLSFQLTVWTPAIDIDNDIQQRNSFTVEARLDFLKDLVCS